MLILWLVISWCLFVYLKGQTIMGKSHQLNFGTAQIEPENWKLSYKRRLNGKSTRRLKLLREYNNIWVFCYNSLKGSHLGSDGVEAINNGFHLVWWSMGRSGFWCNDRRDDWNAPKMLGTPNCQVLRRTGCAMCHKARLAVPLLNLVCVQTTAGSSDTSLVSRLPTASLIQGKPP